MTAAFTESTVESATLSWLSELGWQVKHGSGMAPDGLFAERQDFGHVVLECWSSGCAMRCCPSSSAARFG
jgi:hypothetical protein